MLHSNFDGGKSLLQVLDHTLSPMGARTLRKWVVLPLKELAPIEERLETVEALIKDQELSTQLAHRMRQIGDLERLIAKVSLGKISPRELLHVRRALQAIEEIKDLLANHSSPHLKTFSEQLHPCRLIRE